jgi:acetolactate decarboxylase
MGTFFQAGTLLAFLQGIYEGDYTFANLAKAGNFGLGTLNGVDGEMVAVDGVFYRIDANGVASVISPEAKTPFSVVSKFQPVKPFEIANITSITQLNTLLDSHLKTTNIFYMIRIDGEFEWLKLRSEKCQIRPYRPLAETLPQLQHIFELTHSQGTLVVSRCPHYSEAFTIPGYHYHYIDDKRTTGGHVFDFRIKSARVMINPLREFSMALFDTEAFDNADLEINIQDALKKIE